MKQRRCLLLVLLAAFSARALGQPETIFPIGEISTADNHTGTVWLTELAPADSIFSYNIAMATFAAGAKLDWHIHPAGQILLITEGIGYYQERGKPVQVVRKGEIIKCAPGVEHWHGATPGSSVTYIATTPAQKGKTIWLRRLSDSEYRSQNAARTSSQEQQQMMRLSKTKWDWMAGKNVDSLDALFNSKAVFVHMGGTWGKDQELSVIKSGGIWYKQAEVYSTNVNIFGNTAILLSDMDLVAVVGGNEVINPFMVTEVYIRENGKWTMGSLTFSHLLRTVKIKN